MEHLYIAQSAVTGAFKIGRSSNPHRRLKELQTGSPYRIKLIFIGKSQGYREKMLHKKLEKHKSQGHKGEWFIEPAIALLPEDIYSELDLEMVNTWWETDTGCIEKPGP